MSSEAASRFCSDAADGREAGREGTDMAFDGRSAFRATPQIVLGLVVVAFGLVLTAGNFGWVEADRVIDLARHYWPLALVLLGLGKILQSDSSSGRITGGVFVLIGGWLTAEQVYPIPIRIRFWDWWPVLLIAAGALILLRSRSETALQAAGSVPASADQTGTEFAFWSGVRRRIASPAFRRANLTAIMGGIELDLRPASTANGEAVIEVFVMWGGIEITVPPDWDVSNQAIAIMGGADDRSTGGQGARHRLVIRGLVLMGGIDIKT